MYGDIDVRWMDGRTNILMNEWMRIDTCMNGGLSSLERVVMVQKIIRRKNE